MLLSADSMAVVVSCIREVLSAIAAFLAFSFSIHSKLAVAKCTWKSSHVTRSFAQQLSNDRRPWHVMVSSRRRLAGQQVHRKCPSTFAVVCSEAELRLL